MIATAYPVTANAGLTGHLNPIYDHLEYWNRPLDVIVERGGVAALE
jgi:hypothetical protein